jgi:uncharacterized damage-inducible protein DinB
MKMHDFFWRNDRQPSLEDSLHHLSVAYRIWSSLLLELSVSTNWAMVFTQPNEIMGEVELAEYVARAEMECAIASVVHGSPTGMGRHAVHAIRLKLGERAIERVLSHLVEAAKRVLSVKQDAQASLLDAKALVQTLKQAEAELEAPPIPFGLSGDSLEPGRPLEAMPEVAPVQAPGAIQGDSHGHTGTFTVA